jgi:MFS family permease
MFLVAIVVWTLGEIAYSSTAPAVVAGLAPPHLRGRYQGVFGASISIAVFASPALGGPILDRFGVAWLWSACLVLGLVIAGLHLTLTGAYRRGAPVAGEGADVGAVDPAGAASVAAG